MEVIAFWHEHLNANLLYSGLNYYWFRDWTHSTQTLKNQRQGKTRVRKRKFHKSFLRQCFVVCLRNGIPPESVARFWGVPPSCYWACIAWFYWCFEERSSGYTTSPAAASRSIKLNLVAFAPDRVRADCYKMPQRPWIQVSQHQQGVYDLVLLWSSTSWFRGVTFNNLPTEFHQWLSFLSTWGEKKTRTRRSTILQWVSVLLLCYSSFLIVTISIQLSVILTTVLKIYSAIRYATDFSEGTFASL